MANPAAVNLSSAAPFALLAGTGITIAGAVLSSAVTGDIGTFPTATITGTGNLVLTGTNHAGDAVTQLAKTDLTAAYLDAAGRAADVSYGPVYDLGGSTLGPGVYAGASSLAITGVLTLDGGGDPNARWIFKAGSSLNPANGSSVLLINGAQACNVFWQVTSSAVLGTTAAFSGNILALTSITLNTGATVTGRMLARNGAVTLDTNTVEVCVLSTSAPSTSRIMALAACLRSPRIDLVARKAMQVYAMASQLAALGGTNYTGDYTALLRASCDWIKLGPGSPSDGRDAAFTALLLENAETAGAPGLTDAELLAAIKCLRSYDLNHLDAMWLRLYQELGPNAPIA
jgi:hypothetical protein